MDKATRFERTVESFLSERPKEEDVTKVPNEESLSRKIIQANVYALDTIAYIG